MRIIRFLLLLGALAVVSIAAATFWLFSEVNTPQQLPARSVLVSIPRGATFEETLNLLTGAGVIKRTLPLRAFLKLQGGYPLVQAGTYEFKSPLSPIGAMNVLKEGARAERLTVIEGWTRWDIAQAMSQIKALRLANEKSALPLMDDVSLVSDIDPQAANLEGYLFPDTYFVVENMTPKEVVSAMVKRFRQVWTDKLASRAAEQSRSIHEIVTIASLVETEAKLDSERSVVASVIYNRLARGMALGVDSSIVYASRLAGKWRNDGKVYLSDVNRRSPYNTRIFNGLPPGPVGSPGLLSLTAALYPASTNYLYYVRNPDRNDGAHNFYASAGEFEKGVKALRNWERRRDARH